MNFRGSLFLSSVFLTLTASPTEAQKLKKADKAIIAQLSQHINYLSHSSDTEEIRELMAMDYISSQFKKLDLEAKGDNGSYVHSFDIPLGWGISSSTYLSINNEVLPSNGYFPLLLSPHIVLDASPTLGLPETGEPWFLDLKELLEDSGANVKSYIAQKATNAHANGAKVLFLYNTSDVKDNLEFDGNEKGDTLPLPVVYIRQPWAKKFFSDETASIDLKLNVELVENKRQGKYVIGFINNSSPKTVMIATNEMNDNTAVLLEVADLLKNSKTKNNNYLLIAFFEKEAVSPNPAMHPEKANYLININGSGDTDKLNYIYTLVEKAK